MTARQIVWYPEAAGDLDDIVERLAASGSHLNAERVLARLESAVGALRSAPNRGRVVPELVAYGIRRYRELIVTPWRVVYRVEGRTIYVLTLIDSRRDLDELLLERLIRSD